MPWPPLHARCWILPAFRLREGLPKEMVDPPFARLDSFAAGSITTPDLEFSFAGRPLDSTIS